MKGSIRLETANILEIARSFGKSKKKKKLQSFCFMYDAEANAAYLKYHDVPVAKTLKVDENTNADFDAKGNLIGIEYLNINK